MCKRTDSQVYRQILQIIFSGIGRKINNIKHIYVNMLIELCYGKYVVNIQAYAFCPFYVYLKYTILYKY
jgi:hypothetical protein